VRLFLGGAVALWLLYTGVWDGPALVISPALKRALTVRHSKEEAQERMEEVYATLRSKYEGWESLVTIIHGDADDTVPVDDSNELCDKTGFNLIIAPQGDHKLNYYLIRDGNLVRFVEMGLRVTL